MTKSKDGKITLKIIDNNLSQVLLDQDYVENGALKHFWKDFDCYPGILQDHFRLILASFRAFAVVSSKKSNRRTKNHLLSLGTITCIFIILCCMEIFRSMTKINNFFI